MTTTAITLTTKEAYIILDWYNSHWYVSNVSYIGPTPSQPSTTPDSSANTQNAGVKVPEWSKEYKYAEQDIVAYQGGLFVSTQATNINHPPIGDAFWWSPLYNLSAVDAVSIGGKSITDIVNMVLGGNTITDYYKKSEVEELMLLYFNAVNAEKLSGWKLTDIQANYTKMVSDLEKSSKLYTDNFISGNSFTALETELLNIFDTTISADNVNR